MLFGSDKQLSKQIKRLALNSNAVKEDIIQKAVQISKIRFHKKHNTFQSASVNNDILHLEETQFPSRHPLEESPSRKQGLHVGDELFILGSQRFLPMLDLVYLRFGSLQMCLMYR